MQHYLNEAIERRVSRRVYHRLPLKKKDADSLIKLIESYNRESGLDIALIEMEESLFAKRSSSYGLLTDVINYIAIMGKATDKDLGCKAGYYGELLVLEATMRGLATCWVSGSYNKKLAQNLIGLEDGNVLVCLIVVGYAPKSLTTKETLLSKAIKTRKKKPEDILTAETPPPEWVQKGIAAAMLAPSSANSMPVTYTYSKEGRLWAKLLKNKASNSIDLGISLVHFEIGAGVGKWFKSNDVWTFRVMGNAADSRQANGG
ncbi:MAG: nitroreductase family protein [Eubacteriaceae bacterium]|nr:nitroreductase family protein [Eubacteriaceae bacterium]